MHILCLRSFLFLTRVERSTSVLAAQHGQHCRGKNKKDSCAAGRLLSRQQLCSLLHSNRAKTLPSPPPCLFLLVATDRPRLIFGLRAVRIAEEARTRQPLFLCLSVRKFRVGSARVCAFAKSILERHARNYAKAFAESNLPFVSYETARIADRQDKFARKIFITSLREPRTRLNLEEFRLFRAYFFGVHCIHKIRGDEKRECSNVALLDGM